MARKFTLQIIMDLASKIGANPAKAISRSNVSFLGKGPTKNPLFQNHLAGLENASPANLGKPEALFAAIDDAVGWAKDGKLNGIQTEILGHNLSGIEKIINPPPLPMASVTPIRSGIKTVAPKPMTDIDRLFQGPITTTGPKGTRTWDFTRKYPKGVQPGSTMAKAIDEANAIKKSRLQETGPGDIEAFTKVLDYKTAWSRSIARQILQQDTRLKLPEEVLISLRTGSRGPDPLDLMKKYYGRSMFNLDDFLDNATIRDPNAIKDIASRVLSEVELIPQFAQGGLARILEV